MAFAIESSAFAHGGAIPRRCTCDGEDVSPPLRWLAAPDKTRSFTLIVDDPDAPDPAAPKRVYVHWVLYDVPASVTKIDEDGEGTCSRPRSS
jgi:Raf kinase inhibitor-like YbhB/YbcL family protein